MTHQRVFLSPPFIGDEEKNAVMAALDSGWVAPAGPSLEDFERRVAARSERRYAVAVSSGTAALHLSLISLKVRPGDIVICPTMTFVASANAIRYAGAVPYFVDSDPSTGNLSPDLLRRAIQSLLRAGEPLVGVIAVDFLGKCADYDSIVPLCNEHELFLLADSAESIGASYRGMPAGSFGDIAIFSFNGNKIITSSSGGMVVTDNEDIARRVRFLSTQAREPQVFYEHAELGYNYRLSNVLAALGLAQLEKLDLFIEKRRTLRGKYRLLFEEVQGVEVFGAPDFEDNFWLTSILVDRQVLSWGPGELLQYLENYGIESRPLWKPMHLQPLYVNSHATLDGSSERLFLEGLALPSGSALDGNQWERIETTIRMFLAEKTSK
jgi:dTDP-4-amino-4,6-dideoxygalactose transaminase